MSSLAAPLSAARRAQARPLPFDRVRADAGLTIAVGLTLAAVAFVADGGLRLERTTWTEIGLLLLGAGLTAAVLLTDRVRGEIPGAMTLLALAGLAVFTALSIVWSLAPSDSWLEANRTLAYLAAFAGALALVRLAPERWAAVLHGVGLACLLVCAWALATKVFPAALAPGETYARLREPFGYWNAVGLMAALGVPPLLWLAARRSGDAAVNALAWPGLGLLAVCMMLSYSRGALLALLVGLAFWFAVVPLRLRGATALVGSLVGAAPVVAWAFRRDALTLDRVPLSARGDAGHELGALLLLMAALLVTAGLAVNFLAARRAPSARLRRLAGRGILGALAIIPVVVVVAIATAPGGLSGQVSTSWHRLTDPKAATPTNTPDRLTATSSVRAAYWREALAVYRHSKWIGAGAGAFGTARTRYRYSTQSVRHAHGYVVQTLSDLGLVGLGLSLLAALAWLVAAARTLGLRRRDRGLAFDAERVGMLTMATVVLVFTVHSLIDWTWFVPGNAAVALLCAAWVAGRGPLRARTEAAVVVAPPARGPWRERLRAWRPPRTGAAGALAVLAVALVGSWMALQPVRSAHAEDAAIDRAQIGAYDAAASISRTAAKRNPLSVDPLWQLAFIDDAKGDKQGALHALEQAVKLQPANAEAWRRLGRYRLSSLNNPEGAVAAFRATYFLDPQPAQSSSDFLEASRALQQR